MRKIKYDQYKSEIISRNSSLSKIPQTRLIRRKPRAKKELHYLIKHALARKEQALLSNEYEILGPRRWRVNAVRDSSQTAKRD